MMTDTWTWATVTQATPLRIKVDGDTTALDATTDNLVGSLAVDDRVRVHLHADGIIVTGLQGGVVGTTEATSATANTLALRDGDGQLKAADGVAADDVATVGQLGQTLHTSGIGRLSGQFTATTTNNDLPDAASGTLALLTGDVAFITAAFDIDGYSGIFLGKFYINGVRQDGEAHGEVSGRKTHFQQWRYVVPSDGNYTLKLVAATTASTATVYEKHTSIMWQVFR